jgi:hypothetical protein
MYYLYKESQGLEKHLGTSKSTQVSYKAHLYGFEEAHSLRQTQRFCTKQYVR